jgi:hypothetical protein
MSETPEDGEAWLTRLSVDEWLRAAEGELVRAEEALRRKQQRAGVAQARRAAGMAWNAVLRSMKDAGDRGVDEKYGRSYMDHLRVLVGDETVPGVVREAAHALVTAPLEAELVQLGEGDTRLARAAQVIVDESRRRADGAMRS